tara:strand:- start:111 stop:632 length:522 start_codon:yes stop_codon:yes gene_type:complete
MKTKKNKGTLIWVTGLSGSGKSYIAKEIKKKLNEKKINNIIIHGDDLRRIFKLNKYDKKSRLSYAYSYSLLCKKITNQGINVIIATIAMFHEIRKWNRKNIKNYYEVYLKTSYNLIKKRNKKKLYLSKKINVIGKDIKPELPKNPDFIFNNNFKNQDQNIDFLFSKIENFIKK